MPARNYGQLTPFFYDIIMFLNDNKNHKQNKNIHFLTALVKTHYF